MSEQFSFDVFLSHSSKDKPIVHALAERLRSDGLRVWLDDWEIHPGDSIPAKLEEGLEQSRVLVLCMSANAFSSDWSQLEAGTFRFRDPLNKERRFVPLRLDDSRIKGALAQFLYINWLPSDRQQEYAKLLEACRAQTKPTESEAGTGHDETSTKAIRLGNHKNTTVLAYAFSADGKHALTGLYGGTLLFWETDTGRRLRVLEGHTSHININAVVCSANKERALSGSDDLTVRLWDLKAGRCIRVLEGHTATIWGVSWSTDERRALSCSSDNTVRLWDVETGRCIRVLEGHTASVHSVEWSHDQRYAISGSGDNTIRLWELESGRCLQVLQGHTSRVWSALLSFDQRMALSSSNDGTVRLWEVGTNQCVRILEGHTGDVMCLAWSPDQRYALSGAIDNTVRLWNLETGRLLRVLKGHTDSIRRVAWSVDGQRAFSGDAKSGIRIWNLAEVVNELFASRLTVSALSIATDQVQYTNAKVLVVGDTGVGKTGLSNYLANGVKVEDGRPLSSTDGAWATHWPLRNTMAKAGVEREIWLWDFAGQVDYRLVHQIFMNDAAAAVLVFNPQNENPFEGLGQWDRDLQKATRKFYAKLVVAGRIDRGGLVVSSGNMTKFMAERGFLQPLHLTSAKTGEGCDELRAAIAKAIDWKGIPETTSPALYHRIKQEILRLRDQGLVLIRLSELKQRMEITLHEEDFELAELEAVVSLLSGPGMIQRLDFGGFILLRPEVLSRYAAAVVRKVRKHSQEMGCIREDELLAGDLDYQDFERLIRDDEAVVLRTLLETFISRAWCLRQPFEGTAMLTFPSYFRRERKEQPSHPSVMVTYRFDGPTDEIYATLVVRLHHTVAFESTDLWKSAADFKTQTGAALGFTLMRESEGTSRLEVYFEPDVDQNSRVLFLRYVHDHLTQHAQNVARLRHYACGNKKCDSLGQAFIDHAKIDKAQAPGGKGKVFCQDCGKSILLHDVIEEKFDSATVKEQVRELQIEGQVVLDNESRELVLVGHAFSIVAEAGQIFRPTTNSDHGIDGEVEFKDHHGRASGKRLYVQLKSGDSYLKKRERDGAEIFQIKNPRWADYWQEQAYPVMLVIRTSDGEIRWMDVSAYLKRESAGGKAVKRIVFEGDPFDVMSVRRWRERALRIES
jgi:WD40 repeat protein